MTPRLSIPADTPHNMGNCGIVAVAMLAGVSHADALAAIDKARRAGLGTNTWYGTRQHRKDFGKGWSGFTTHAMRVHALTTLGVTLRDVLPGRQSLLKFARAADPSAKIMVRIARHVLTLHGGLLFDQYHRDGIPVADYPRARSFVTHAHIAAPL